VVTGGRQPNELDQFRWINILFGNLKTSFSGTLHAINVDKCANFLSATSVPFLIGVFAMSAMTEQIANAVCDCKPCPERASRVAELYAESRCGLDC
jgi:hypothetical protein